MMLPGTKRRLQKMARKASNKARTLYAIAAGYFPDNFLTLNRAYEGAGRVRYVTFSRSVRMLFDIPLQNCIVRRSEMRGIRAYRKNYPQVSLRDGR
jgi:hypothetical protein